MAAGVDLPIVVQDHLASPHSFMSVAPLVRLVSEISTVQCIKEEHPPTPQEVSALVAGMKKRRLGILQGLGALYGIFDLSAAPTGS